MDRLYSPENLKPGQEYYIELRSKKGRPQRAWNGKFLRIEIVNGVLCIVLRDEYRDKRVHSSTIYRIAFTSKTRLYYDPEPCHGK